MKYLKCLAITIFVLTIWILLNSIDDRSYDDLGIHHKLVKVQDTENGYYCVQYLNSPDFKMFESDDTPERIRNHVKGVEWEQTFVDKILQNKSYIIKDIELATQRPFFKFPDYGDDNSLPWFSNFRSASFILLLESKNYLKANDFNNSIERLKIALKFGQLIKSEENSLLVSYAIGSSLHMSQTIFVNHLLNFGDLDDKNLRDIQNALDEIDEYHEDGFKKVFWGEYNYIAFSIEEEKNKTLGQRLNDYQAYKQLIADKNINALIELFGFTKPGGNQFSRAIFPNYFFHPNEFLSSVAYQNIKMSEQANNFYKDMISPRSSPKPSWLDSISPNSMTKENLAELSEVYTPFFERRCLNHVYFDAIHTIIALRRYSLLHGKLPENLDLLVPKYLKRLPIDYFDGNTLRYSKKDRWVYSIGVNLKDNGGSHSGFIESKDWRENPTIPIFSK